jgi:hypothetical protein
MKGIVRIVVLALIAFGLYAGYQKARMAYDRHELDKGATASIDKLPPGQQRIGSMAAYLGFYWANDTLLPSLCREQGVDLQTYSTAFHERYAQDHDRVHDAFRAQGQSERQLATAMSGLREPRTAFVALLEKIGDRYGKDATVAQGCAVVQKRQDIALDFMNFEALFPTVWRRMELP